MDFQLHQLQPHSPLINGLVFRKKSVRALFRTINWLYGKKSSLALPQHPRKILLSNTGHLGDVLICFQTIGALKELYPKAQFGFLLSSLGKPALEKVDAIDRIHVFDHAYGLRRKMGICKAVLQHRRQLRKIVDELRFEQYDMAIDLEPFFPNAIPLLKKAAIPIRIGYPTGGFGRLLTHPFDWREFGKYLGALHVDHLMEIGFAVRKECSPISFAGCEYATIDLSVPFFVVQMRSSKQEKDWHRDGWITLIRTLKNNGCQALLVGRGVVDREECEMVSRETGALNGCDRWSIPEYGEVLKRAKLLITVDSMSVHLAALYEVPTVVALAEINCPHLWIPSKKVCTIVDLRREGAGKRMVETSLALMR